MGAIAQLGERVLCKHEVVGSIPSGSTSDRGRGSGIRGGVGPVDPIGDVPGASVRTIGIRRRALGLGWRIVRLRGGRARGIASLLFDIVKSECVRSSGSVPQGGGVRSSRMMFSAFSASVHQVRGGGVVHR